jgi:hypothetical protein
MSLEQMIPQQMSVLFGWTSINHHYNSTCNHKIRELSIRTKDVTGYPYIMRPYKKFKCWFFGGKSINTIYDVKDVLWRFSQSFRTTFQTVCHTTAIPIMLLFVTTLLGLLILGGYLISVQTVLHCLVQSQVSKVGRAGFLGDSFWLLYLSPSR